MKKDIPMVDLIALKRSIQVVVEELNRVGGNLDLMEDGKQYSEDLFEASDLLSELINTYL